MYIVASTKSAVSLEELKSLEQEIDFKLPAAYCSFITMYGQGTYGGWMNITAPDPLVLQPFAEYGFWEHDEDCPISEDQIAELVSIGSSVDGDFLAVHPKLDGLLWLPRHAEVIAYIALEDISFTKMLDQLFCEKYEQVEVGPAYFEPWSHLREHMFYHFSPDEAGYELPELAHKCKKCFKPELTLENEYSCKLFYREIHGYVRFNYAYKHEVAIFFERKEQGLLHELVRFLEDHFAKPVS